MKDTNRNLSIPLKYDLKSSIMKENLDSNIESKTDNSLTDKSSLLNSKLFKFKQNNSVVR